MSGVIYATKRYKYDKMSRISPTRQLPAARLRLNPVTSHMTSQIESRILEIVSDLALTKVSLDDPLLDTNLIDSISAVDLALRIEEEFNCPIPPQEITEHMKTTRTLVAYVLQHQ